VTGNSTVRAAADLVADSGLKFVVILIITISLWTLQLSLDIDNLTALIKPSRFV